MNLKNTHSRGFTCKQNEKKK